MYGIARKIFTGSILCVLLLGSCESRLDKMEYIKWVKNYDNDLHVRSVVSDYIFDLQFQPSEYVLLQRGSESMSAAERIEELKKLSGMQYYILTISTADKTDVINYGVTSPVEKQQRQYYFSYEFQNDISLEEDGKELPCVLYHSERPTDQHGGKTFVLGFENQNENSKEAKVVIRSEVLGSLPVKIKVLKKNIPHVEL